AAGVCGGGPPSRAALPAPAELGGDAPAAGLPSVEPRGLSDGNGPRGRAADRRRGLRALSGLDGHPRARRRLLSLPDRAARSRLPGAAGTPRPPAAAPQRISRKHLL